MRSADLLICVSRHIQRLAIELGANPENTTVIGTGVDTRKIQVSEIPDAPVILHVARLVEKKGTADLVSAFALVLKKIPEARLRIIGSGPLEEKLKAQVAQLALTDSVDFLGVQPHDRVLAELQGARLLCLPSITAASGDQEGLGQVILEAGATGRPVIATEHGGILDAVVNGETGLLVRERDVAGLAELLIAVLDDKELAARLGLSARGRVEREFDVQSQAQKVDAVYRRAMS
ncbi:hypothetical protein StoSoilA2_34170 [Arthrobacter sp. StoSoilA2]|nr:hypothetical protein StoSoilA2_34170 [Arthrobacter sp. StoSoilA2]